MAAPVCLWAWVLWRAGLERTNGAVYRWMVRLFPLILLINVLEVALRQFESGDSINAIYLTLIGITVPLGWTIDSTRRLLGFRDWHRITAFTTSLLFAYIPDPTFQNSCFAVNAVLLIAAGALPSFCEIPMSWMTWRTYTLVLMVYQDSTDGLVVQPALPGLAAPRISYVQNSAKLLILAKNNRKFKSSIFENL